MATFTIAAISAIKTEGTGGTTAFTFEVTPTGSILPGFPEGVSFGVSGTGANPASALDFFGGIFPSGILSFSSLTPQLITIEVAGDSIAELDESFQITLSNPTNGAILGTASATGQILNDDPLLGTAGNDLLNGTLQNDIIQGLGGNDTIRGSAGDDLLDGGSGTDTANYAALGQAITLKSQGVIQKAGGLGTDTIVGIERIIGATGLANTIDGTVVGAQATSFNINLGGNSLTVNGIPGIGSQSFTVQNFVNVTGTANADNITGSAGNNTLIGGGGNDILVGTAGNDLLDGGAGTDTVSYAALGQSITLKSQGVIQKGGGLGTDTIVGIERIIGAAGRTNVIDGGIVGPQTTNFIVDLGANSLTVNGIPGPVSSQSFTVENFVNVRGTANADIITGNAATNTFFGSKGNDTYDGKGGTDTVTYAGLGQAVTLKSQGVIEKAGGSGTDTIAGIERIIGATGLANAIDGTVVGPQTTSFNVNLGANSLTVNGIPGPVSSQSFTVENFANVTGTANADSITGSAGNNTLIGGGGNDTLVGTTGNDLLDGGAGTDTVNYAGLGQTVTLKSQGVIQKGGGLGTDTIAGIERIIGATGLANTIDGTVVGAQATSFNINLRGNSLTVNGIPGLGSQSFTVENFVNVTGTANADSIAGSSANNVLAGGGGDDSLVGSAGNDVLDGGAGIDTADYSGLGSGIRLKSQGVIEKLSGVLGTDTIVGIERIIGAAGADNTIDGTVVGVQATSFVIDLGANSLTVNGIPGLGSQSFTVENFINVTGTANADSITGSSADNVLAGGVGDDSLFGTAGNDLLDGGAGTDTANYAALGQAITLKSQGVIEKAGGLGTDTIASIERIIGGIGLANAIDGTVVGAQVTSFDINLGANSLTVNGIPGLGSQSFSVENFANVTGTANADVITGSAVANTFFGSKGNDTYDGAGGTDTVNYAGLGQAVTLKSQGVIQKSGSLGTDTIAGIERIIGATGLANAIDGTVAGAQVTSFSINLGANSLTVNGIPGLGSQSFTVENFANVTGTANADIITGSAAANSFFGSKGNDTYDGAGGTDTVTYAGLGQAVTLKSQGVIEKAGGFGTDTIAGVERIIGDTGLANAIDGTVVGAQATSFVVDLGGNSLTVNGVPGLGSLSFMVQNFANVTGTANADVITGSAVANTFFGSKGNDKYDGAGATDTVDYAGLGQAVTLKSQGVIQKAGGVGTDTIAGIERIIGATGLANAIDGTVVGAQVTSFNIDLGANSLTVNGIPGLGSQSFTVENFANVTGTANADIITGSAAANSFFGSKGNDTYNGAGGTDTINYAGLGQSITLKSQGVIQKGGSFGTDTIAGIERIIGAAGRTNVIDGGIVGPQTTSFIVDLGANSLTVNGIPGPVSSQSFTVENFVSVRGTANADIITGNAAANTFFGSKGNDQYDGAGGLDTVDYARLGRAITLKSQGVIEKAGGLGTDAIAGIERIIGATGLANAIDGTVMGAQVTSFNINLGANSLTVNGIPGPVSSQSFTVQNFVNVTGTANADSITGSAGNNTLIGGLGADLLTGGGGADRFVYLAVGESTPAPAGRDTITDFASTGGDKIDVSAIDADTTLAGDQAFTLLPGDFDGLFGGQISIIDTGTNRLVRFDIDKDGIEDMSITVISSLALTASDFIL